MQTTTVVIDSRFNGPPDSANGGYTAGLLAQHCEGPAEVTLRKPPPLARPLHLECEEGQVQLLDGEVLVATAQRVAPLELTPPVAPSVADAVACGAHYRGFDDHAFPYCFVCGPRRSQGDGLRIFPGSCAHEAFVACTWVPDASLCDSQGSVTTPVLWAALDCPGYFATSQPGEVAVLGRMALERLSAPRADETCVVVGWSLSREGRKLQAGTALFSAAGQLHARARQTWITLT